jgi:hypothetical protein
MRFLGNVLLFAALGYAALFAYRSLVEKGWALPDFRGSFAPPDMPDTQGYGRGIACGWRGTC